MQLKDFNFELPEELIARYPLEKRDQSRLLVYEAQKAEIKHGLFKDLVQYFKPGDLLVRNNSRVLPARFYVSNASGSRIEILLTEKISTQNSTNRYWKALAKPMKKIKDTAQEFICDNGLAINIQRCVDEALIDFISEENFTRVINECGLMPIPPYFKREADANDKERYQTIYAHESQSGSSIAAPTAGLHFTDEIIQQLQDKGVRILDLTLHVGLGTFLPVRVENIAEHKMHSEFYEINPEFWQEILRAKANGQRVFATGTTSCRVLETIANTGILSASTDIFIYPGYEFKIVDGLITNFHLPESTLILLVSAFLGKEIINKIYQEAIEKKYRFFSYGDCCLFLR